MRTFYAGTTVLTSPFDPSVSHGIFARLFLILGRDRVKSVALSRRPDGGGLLFSPRSIDTTESDRQDRAEEPCPLEPERIHSTSAVFPAPLLRLPHVTYSTDPNFPIFGSWRFARRAWVATKAPTTPVSLSQF